MAHFAAFRTASIKLRSVFNLSPQSSNSTQQQEHNRFSEGVERWARPSASPVLSSSVSTNDAPDSHTKEDHDDKKTPTVDDSHQSQGLRSKSVDDSVSGAPVYADPTTYTESDELPTLANSTIDRCNRILQQSMDRWERAAVVHSGSPIDAGDDLYETSQTYPRRQIAVPKRSPIRHAAANTTSTAAPSATESKSTMPVTTQNVATTENSHASSQTASPTRRELSSSFLTVAPSSGYSANNFSTSTNFAKTISIEITKATSPSTNAAYTAVTAPAEVTNERHFQTEEDNTAPQESDAMSTTEQYEKVTSKKKKSAKDSKQKDMNVISDRVRRELIAPEKPVTAKIVKFSKNGFPVVRFTGQFSWIGLRAKVAAESDSSFDNYKVGQNVYVQITDIYQESESDSESYWLVDCKLREEAGVPNPAANPTVNHQHMASTASQSHDESQNASQGGSSTSPRLKFGPVEKKGTTTKTSASRAPLDPSASTFVPSTAALTPAAAPPAPQPYMPQQQQQQRFFVGQGYYVTPVYYLPMPHQQAPYPAQYSPSPYDYFTSVADQYGLR